MTRHQMRQSVFMLTFERIFNDDPIDTVLELAAECETVEVDDTVKRLFRGVESKKNELDEAIRPHLKNWTIDRISKVSLAVLRVAMYEIYYVKDIDTDIAISEAVKIAQEFTGKEDVSFVNGVLSSVSKALLNDQRKGGKSAQSAENGENAVSGQTTSSGTEEVEAKEPVSPEPTTEKR